MDSQVERNAFFAIFSQPQEPAVSEEDQKPPEDLLPEEEIDKQLDNLFSSSTMNDDLLLSLDESKQPQRVGSGTFDDILKSFGGEGGAAGKNMIYYDFCKPHYQKISESCNRSIPASCVGQEPSTINSAPSLIRT